MRKVSAVITFFIGAVAGAATAWGYAKQKYAALAEQEIKSVKESFAKLEQRRQKEDISPRTPLTATKVQDKQDIRDYHTTPKSGPEPVQNEEDLIYVISPDEFGEVDGYESVSYLYFQDGILADEYGIIVDDVEEIIGDGLEHFGEYEEDSVFVRNDIKHCDYEILCDSRSYEDFRKTLPSNI